MSSDIAIKVENLSKCYQVYDTPRDRLKQFILPRFCRLLGLTVKNFYREFWALKDVSFEVKKGETVGIIGRNGSGKSTLLQLICGTIHPTNGNIQTHGRIASLLELGSGFNPEFTGRENVYMNGAILGLTPKEIDARFNEIAAFADIGAFMEQPVKVYSSGMFVRLAFASNIMSDPEIMIVDEALSVGDMNFQAKCMTALTQIQKRGATILFVSHDVGSVKSLCSRCLYLDAGRAVAIGASAQVAERYVRAMREEMNDELKRFVRVPPSYNTPPEIITQKLSSTASFKRCPVFEQRVAQFRYGSGEVKVTCVDLLNLDGDEVAIVEFNQRIKLRIYFEAYSEKMVSVNFGIFDDKKNNILGCGFVHADHSYIKSRYGDQYIAEYTFDVSLQEGAYAIRINISSPVIENESVEFVDVVDNAIVFKMLRWSKARIWSKVHSFAELNLRKIAEDNE